MEREGEERVVDSIGVEGVRRRQERKEAKGDGEEWAIDRERSVEATSANQLTETFVQFHLHRA